MPYDLFDEKGNWFASVPNKEMRDNACADYFEKNDAELTYREISSAEYSEVVAASRRLQLLDIVSGWNGVES